MNEELDARLVGTFLRWVESTYGPEEVLDLIDDEEALDARIQEFLTQGV